MVKYVGEQPEDTIEVEVEKKWIDSKVRHLNQTKKNYGKAIYSEIICKISFGLK